MIRPHKKISPDNGNELDSSMSSTIRSKPQFLSSTAIAKVVVPDDDNKIVGVLRPSMSLRSEIYGNENSVLSNIIKQPHWIVYYIESSSDDELFLSKTLTNQQNLDLATAEVESKASLEEKESLIGTDAAEMLDLVDDLAHITWKQGKSKIRETEKSFKKSIALRAKISDWEDDQKTVEILDEYITILLVRNKISDAEELCKRMLSSCQHLFGEDHLTTLFAAQKLASILRRLQKHHQAEIAYKRARLGFQKSLGLEHLVTLSAANDEAVQLCQQSKYDEAIKLFEHVHEGRTKALGFDHPDTMAAMGNLAVAYHLKGEIIKAFENYKIAMGMDRGGVWSELETNLCHIASNLAHLHLDEDQIEESLALFVRVFESRLELLGDSHPYTIDTIKLLTNIYQKQNNHQKLKYIKDRISFSASYSATNTKQSWRVEYDAPGDDVVLPPFPQWGVSLQLLRRIKELADPDWTTTTVCERLIKPWTEHKKCSFVELMYTEYRDIPHPIINMKYHECFAEKATVFVSHAWSYKYNLDLVASIETFFVDQLQNNNQSSKGSETSNQPSNSSSNNSGNSANSSSILTPDNTFLWVDLFVNDQWNASALPYEWWTGTFLSAIGKIGHTMLILAPWSAPIPLTRAWCLWEILSTIRTGSLLTIQLSDYQRKSFQNEIRNDENCLINALSNINVESSGAWNLADRDKIFKAVEQFNSFRNVNNIITSKFREWAEKSLNQMKDDPFHGLSIASNSTQEHSLEYMKSLRLVQDKVLLADIYSVQNRSNEAELLYVEALNEFGKLLLGQDDDVETLKIVAKLATLYRNQKKHLEAVKMYIRILRGFEKKLGKDHPDTLRTRSHMATIYKEHKEYDEAAKIYMNILDKFLSIHPADHRDTLLTYHNLGSLLAEKGNISEASSMFTKALEGFERSLGKDHPDTLKSVHEMAKLLQLQRKYKEAEVMYTRAETGFEKAFGYKHPITIRVAADAAALRSYFYRNPFSSFAIDTSKG